MKLYLFVSHNFLRVGVVNLLKTMQIYKINQETLIIPDVPAKPTQIQEKIQIRGVVVRGNREAARPRPLLGDALVHLCGVPKEA